MATQNTFDFGDQQAATKSLKKISQLMQRAGQPVVSTSFDPKAKRTSGVTYREAMLTLASGQTVTMRVTQTGDVFQVLLNGQIKPIKNAGDQIRAVGEIAKLAESGQAAFQKKQARVKTELPKSVKTAAPKMEVALQSRVAELDAQIAERTQQVGEMQAELGGEESTPVGMVSAYQRGVQGLVYYQQSDAIAEPQFIPLRDASGKLTGDEANATNLYKSQEEADGANSRVKAALGVSSARLDNVITLDSAGTGFTPSKTTISYAKRRGLDIELSGGILEFYEYGEDSEPLFTYLAGKDGFTFKGNISLDKKIKEELPHWIKSDTDLRRVIDFVGKEVKSLDSATLDGIDHNWHSRTMDAMKLKTDDSLRYIYKDATEAADAGEKMDNPKSGQYRDEAHYASMELERRRKLRTGGQLAKAMAKAVKSANNGKLLIANVPDDLKFAVPELIKSRVISSADFAGNKAIRMTDATLDSATLDAARKHNQKDYSVYVVVGNKIESGWEYDDDAKEHKAENMPANLRASAKVLKKAALKSKGIDPDDNASWLTGAALDSADLSEAQAIAAQVLDGAVLDSASTVSAVATLRIALDVAENNYPINLAAGNVKQAQLEQESAESFRHAIALLDGADEPEPSDASDEAIKANEDLEDGFDDDSEVSPDQESMFD